MSCHIRNTDVPTTNLCLKKKVTSADKLSSESGLTGELGSGVFVKIIKGTPPMGGYSPMFGVQHLVLRGWPELWLPFIPFDSASLCSVGVLVPEGG